MDGLGRLTKGGAQGFVGGVALDQKFAMRGDVGQAATGANRGDFLVDRRVATGETPLAHVVHVTGAEALGRGVERGKLERWIHERSLSPFGS